MVLKKTQNITEIIRILERNYKKIDKSLILDAYNFASRAHKGQKRLTGEDFVTHPLIVAGYLSQLGLDEKAIMAAILHDVLEDTSVTLKIIQEKFGKETAGLVDGVTKLKGIKLYGETKQIENLRKMFLTMAKDIRVVIIRLFDRLHNLQTLDVFNPEKRKKIARQTIEIYAPLAERLGIGELKGKLEDLSFPYLLPRQYKQMKSLVKEKEKERERYIQKIINYLSKKLKKTNIKAEIHGRAKHLYSLYRKLQRYNNDISEIYDLQAVRIIVVNVEDCYEILGLIHREWRPLPGRIKDYIALPKPNGYRSLHTTVFAPENKIIEIQIKTWEMHKEAEWGIAAHWHYTEGKESKDYLRRKVSKIPKDRLRWVKQLVEWQKELKNREEFAESLKIDIFQDRIFVFTPRGDIFNLPKGATPIDFAYHIHTEVGNFCVGAKLDGRIVPLDFKLKNGSMIEIITKKKVIGPKRDWLTFVKTNLAKERIRNWLKRQNRASNLEAGRKLLEEDLRKLGKKSLNKMPKEKTEDLLKEFHYKNLENLLIAIGDGSLTSARVVKKLFSEEFLIKKPESKIAKIPLLRHVFKKPSIQISGEDGVGFKIASCCNPVVGEPIVGFVTRGKGVTIHRKNCPNIKKRDKKQLINVSWGEKSQIYQVPIEIKATDRIGLFKDITSLASNLGINLINISTTSPKNNETSFFAILEINDVSQVMAFFRKVRDIKGVLEVRRK
jgi:GTP diphosphokinase / guanosine-3',5'-bis(diphosphate) 3'-diphosphatase